MELQVPAQKNEKDQSRSQQSQGHPSTREFSRMVWKMKTVAQAILCPSFLPRDLRSAPTYSYQAQCPSSSRSLQGRTTVVDRPHNKKEQQGFMEKSKPKHDWMVSKIEQDQHWRPVEYSRKELAHQLLRDPSSLLGCENVSKVTLKHTHYFASGQHHSCVIYQSPGRHSISPDNGVSEGTMDVVRFWCLK